MDPDLQQALAQLEGRLSARIDGVETRLRSYIDERIEATETKLLRAVDERIERLRTDIDERFERLRTDIDERFEGLRIYIDERVETTETKLLSGFHNWAQTFEVRARGTSAAVREFDERLVIIEERLAKLERSRN